MSGTVEMCEATAEARPSVGGESASSGQGSVLDDDSQYRVQALIDALPMRVFYKDVNSAFVSVNEAFARDLGLTPAQILGKTDLDLFPAELAKKYRADDARVMRSGCAETLEEANVASGQSRVVEVTKRPVIDGRGRVVGLLGLFRDITDLKRAQEQSRRSRAFLHSVIDNLPIMVFIKDAADLRFVLWNKAGEELTGFSRDLFLGKTNHEIYRKEEADAFTAQDFEVLKTGRMLDVPEETMHTRRKGPRILHTRKIPITDAEGVPRYVVGISEDITERKAVEVHLREMAARLEQNNHELQEFAYVASHDLQEPLRKVRAFGDRLRAKCGAALGEQGLDYLDRMQNAARRMQTLIEDLLTYSRVTTHARAFERTDLAEVVQGVLSDLEIRIEQTGAQVKVEELPEIEADSTQMRQLFQNLIGNALKFHRPGQPPAVRIHSRLLPSGARGSSQSGLAEICVEDNGVGFDEKYLDRIFTVFQRLHGREEYEGTGVGLAVCRKIVLRHGGQITARSQPGQGAQFIVTLPVARLKPE